MGELLIDGSFGMQEINNFCHKFSKFQNSLQVTIGGGVISIVLIMIASQANSLYNYMSSFFVKIL